MKLCSTDAIPEGYDARRGGRGAVQRLDAQSSEVRCAKQNK